MSQPYLHELSVALCAPVQCWSAADGQINPVAQSAEGLYLGDDRVLSGLRLSVLGRELEPVAREEAGGARVRYLSIVRTPALGADPVLTVERCRTANPHGLVESLVFRASQGVPDAEPLGIEVEVRLTPDAATMTEVKSGLAAKVAPHRRDAGWSWRPDTRAAVEGGHRQSWDGPELVLGWTLVVPRGSALTVEWRVELEDPAQPFVAPSSAGLSGNSTPYAALVPADADAVRRLLATSLRDLDALRLAPPDRPEETFLAAGAPWFLTLFGRDSLTAARMLLPLDTAPVVGALRALAARQGRRDDPTTAEQPGRILHEVRRVPAEGSEGGIGALMLPPVYYGTIDATMLWVLALHDLWRSGAAADVVVELLPALRAAIGWVTGPADADGDGFVEYWDASGSGLVNQGWKDSADAIRWADGRIAEGPIALVEVQGYAFAAARAAAELLEAHDASVEAARLYAFASGLRRRFHRAFWVRDERGRYPAIALDAHKRPVDGVASNMGHLLGTGILDREEADEVVDRLLHPTLFSGYGIRTLSSDNAAYWPLGYHVGSVWTHDTALIVDGMLREGYRDQARTVARGLLQAAAPFGYRLPELFGGQASADGLGPCPYPAACHPQAWAAASSVVLARALTLTNASDQVSTAVATAVAPDRPGADGADEAQ